MVEPRRSTVSQIESPPQCGVREWDAGPTAANQSMVPQGGIFTERVSAATRSPIRDAYSTVASRLRSMDDRPLSPRRTVPEALFVIVTTSVSVVI